jgi:hypothetical protein
LVLRLVVEVGAGPVATFAGARLWEVTTREKVEELLDRLSEAELEAEYKRLRQAVEGERHVEEWGDLDAQTDSFFADSMKDLAEEERAAGFGPWVREPHS